MHRHPPLPKKTLVIVPFLPPISKIIIFRDKEDSAAACRATNELNRKAWVGFAIEFRLDRFAGLRGAGERERAMAVRATAEKSFAAVSRASYIYVRLQNFEFFFSFFFANGGSIRGVIQLSLCVYVEVGGGFGFL